jgi:hypothetical protein
MVAAVGLIGGSCPAWAGVLPPDSRPYGASYAEWSARWWQWTFAFPVDADPELGTADFSAGQTGKVWFLPPPLNGGTLTRTGVIPAGTALFGPVLNTWADNTGCPTFTDYTVNQLQELVEQSWSVATVTSCTIDGVAVPGMDNPQSSAYLVVSPPFSYTVAAHDNLLANVFGLPCIPDGTTVFPAVAEGVYVMIAPLSVGHHMIEAVAVVGPPSSPFATFDVTYEITVVPGHEQGDPDGPAE